MTAQELHGRIAIALDVVRGIQRLTTSLPREQFADFIADLSNVVRIYSPQSSEAPTVEVPAVTDAELADRKLRELGVRS